MIRDLGVALGPDGALLVVWHEDVPSDRIVSARFAADLTPLSPPIRVDAAGSVTDPVVAADGRGGFVVVYRRRGFPWRLMGRLLDGQGAPLGAEFRADCQGDDQSIGFFHSVTAIPTGFAVLYDGASPPTQGARVCLLDTAGFPRGPGVQLGPYGTARWNDLATQTDGRFLAAYTTSNAGSRAQVLLPDGTPVGTPVDILDGALVRRIAVSPSGGWVAVGLLRDPVEDADDLWMQRLDGDGVPLGPHHVVYEGPPGARITGADVATDEAGNVYVVWHDYGVPAPRLQARGFDAHGVPLGPGLPISTFPQSGGVHTLLLPTGRFANVWPLHSAYGNVVSLCAPGISVCGDGVVVSQCELCDDGPANSDVAPDACRSDCRPARCGDGVIDGAETCDDGNLTSCDGCSATCQAEEGLACGDGVTAHACHETCDDGNGVAGDGCSPTCRLERIPGTGTNRTDCWSEWSIANPTNLPFLDKRGAINVAQRCVDDDPACDFDGGMPGSCTFQIRVCANNTDIPGCSAPTRLRSWTLLGPSAGQAQKDPALAAIRAAFAAVPLALVGPATRDLCTTRSR